ncbi:hypothetical protein [Arthrobacter sp. UYCo732]|uniref:hypothetical protein n=1 Tax=Arthrobacter sp. UYCo732 TaxID=3156336 RepID=UPI0033962681
MTPCTNHRYFLPSYGLAFEASWPRPARTGSSWIRARLQGLLFDGPAPGSPEGTVNPDALSAAVQLIEAQDIEAATMAFTELGYHVRVHAHALR